MNKILKYIYNICILALVTISLWPGSLFGYLFYNDMSRQPILISNPFGSTLNHFIYYLLVSLLGFIIYLKNENAKKILIILLLLSTILEFSHFFVPNRSFEFGDLIANILGVLVAYFVVKIYLLFKSKGT
jgi:VanZ family protein